MKGPRVNRGHATKLNSFIFEKQDRKGWKAYRLKIVMMREASILLN